MQAHRADIARTYVWTRSADDHAVLAYFAFAPTAVFRESLPRGQAGGQSGLIAGYLLGRLALDRSLQGQGLGTDLLVDAIGRIVGVAHLAAGRLIVVDALDDNAAAFYRKHDFTPVTNEPHRLLIKISTAKRLMNLE